LRRVAEGAAPLLLVGGKLAQLSIQDRTERTAAANVALAKTLAGRDKKVLAKARASGVAQTALKKLEAFLIADRQERKTTSNCKSFLTLDDSTRQILHALQRQILPDTRSHVHQLLESHTLLSAELLTTERALANVPTHEAIADLIEQRQRAQIALLNVKAQVSSLDVELDKKRQHIEHLQTRLVRTIDQEVGNDFEKEDNFRTITHSQQVRTVLHQFRSAIVDRHVKQIERLVFDSFQQLLRKQSLISELHIDPKRFEVELRNGDGNVLGADRLSAGERQLLAVSLLWGLARASGRPLPVVTDTPLGRLDASHRMHLVERYFPCASHQMLLLSTDEEIDRGYYEKLKPWVGHSYHLQFDESTSSTHVEAGYFW
jgi:DNA sulfur modification protein DndD